ncbi:SulP family inorganic anion transporter [Nocardioides alcanivorans]|uniref:SulP family inorganic anion transporter n=1 Tax=Nocardioides alcanivorans TaxID=2897352 RepID=UPI001EE9CA13|nr:SulP family inorganic anion transporter [Nocardioides alcanivorans]
MSSADDEGSGAADDGQESAASGFARLYRRRMRRSKRIALRWAGDMRPRRKHFRSDLVAGLPGAISSVPDGMAASVLAGVNPAHGLYASFAGPIAGGLTSSTRLMVVTTTSAAALAAGSSLAALPSEERSGGMIWLTLMAGLLMLGAAALKLSRYIRFVSYSVMLGFLTGVAVNMILGQIPDLVGLEADGNLALTKALNAALNIADLDGATAIAGMAALLILIVLARTRAAVMSSLVALLLPTLGVLWFGSAGVAKVKDGGALPHGLPVPGFPDASSFDPSLILGAVSVAAIILVQGAGVAEAVPNTDGSRSSTRQDFTAQGFGNIASAFVGGQPVGGSVGQTALNVTAGARTRWAGIWSGGWMAIILISLSQVVGEVAMPTLAAILVFAGWSTIHPGEIVTVARAGTIPAVAMTATFTAVIFLPIATAVGVGVIASIVMQLNQETLDLRVVRLSPTTDGAMREAPVPVRVGDGDVVVLNIYGSLFYAGARTLQRRLPRVEAPGHPAPDGSRTGSGQPAGPVVILRLRGRTTLGATFLKVVGDYAHALAAVRGELYLAGLEPELVDRWEQRQLASSLANIRVFEARPRLGASTRDALATATSHRLTPRGDGDSAA